MTKFIYVMFASLLLFSGCATNEGPEYDGRSYKQIKRFEIGTVISEKPVVISDNGSGKFLGALIGAVFGSTVGKGTTSILMSLGGGLAGGYAGSEIGKANGSELSVDLDSGEQVIVVVKGNHIKVGDRIKIIKDGNRVAQVDKVE